MTELEAGPVDPVDFLPTETTSLVTYFQGICPVSGCLWISTERNRERTFAWLDLQVHLRTVHAADCVLALQVRRTVKEELIEEAP